MAHAGQAQAKNSSTAVMGGEQSSRYWEREGVKVLSTEDKLGWSRWEKHSTYNSHLGLWGLSLQASNQTKHLSRAFQRNFQGGTLHSLGCSMAEVLCVCKASLSTSLTEGEMDFFFFKFLVCLSFGFPYCF